jgi:hypothetical protein
MVDTLALCPTYGTCDARRTNHFRLSEIMSSEQFLKIKNFPLPFFPKSAAYCARLTAG